jgi:hypothetical protein
LIQILERSQAKRPQGRANPIIGKAVATGAANALGSQAPKLDCQLPVASEQKLGARNITGTTILALITDSPSDFKRKWRG